MADLDVPACLRPFAPGPIIRVALLFGRRDSALRDEVHRAGAWLGHRTGSWIMVHPLGNPSDGDDAGRADLDRRAAREVAQLEWEEHRSGRSEAFAESLAEIKALDCWGLDANACPCMVLIAPLQCAEPFVIRLGNASLGMQASEVVGAMLSSLDECALLRYIGSKEWENFGPDQFGELAEYIAAVYSQNILDTLDAGKGVAYLNASEVQLLRHLERCSLPQRGRVIASDLNRPEGTVSGWLSKLVRCRLIEKTEHGYVISDLGRLRSLSE